MVFRIVVAVTGRHKVVQLKFQISFTIFIYLEPPELIPITFGRDVVDEGVFAQISCIAMKGDEPLVISWTFHGQGISSSLGIMTTPIGTRGSMLIISSVGHAHSGNYTCTAKNDAGVMSSTSRLTVNGIPYISKEITERQLKYFLTSRDEMPDGCFYDLHY